MARLTRLNPRGVVDYRRPHHVGVSITPFVYGLQRNCGRHLARWVAAVGPRLWGPPVGRVCGVSRVTRSSFSRRWNLDEIVVWTCEAVVTATGVSICPRRVPPLPWRCGPPSASLGAPGHDATKHLPDSESNPKRRLILCLLHHARGSENDNESCKNGAITVSRINVPGYVAHVTIFSWMLTTACVLVVWLLLGLNSAFSWLIFAQFPYVIYTTFRCHCHCPVIRLKT